MVYMGTVNNSNKTWWHVLICVVYNRLEKVFQTSEDSTVHKYYTSNKETKRGKENLEEEKNKNLTDKELCAKNGGNRTLHMKIR